MPNKNLSSYTDSTHTRFEGNCAYSSWNIIIEPVEQIKWSSLRSLLNICVYVYMLWIVTNTMALRLYQVQIGSNIKARWKIESMLSQFIVWQSTLYSLILFMHASIRLRCVCAALCICLPSAVTSRYAEWVISFMFFVLLTAVHVCMCCARKLCYRLRWYCERWVILCIDRFVWFHQTYVRYTPGSPLIYNGTANEMMEGKWKGEGIILTVFLQFHHCRLLYGTLCISSMVSEKRSWRSLILHTWFFVIRNYANVAWSIQSQCKRKILNVNGWVIIEIYNRSISEEKERNNELIWQ